MRNDSGILSASIAGALALLMLFATAPASPAQDWPGFRGPARDGQVSGWPERLAEPGAWPPTLERRWRAAVGLGHASPVTHGDAVVVFTREGEEEVLRALDAATGDERWRSAYPAPYTMHRSAVSHGPGPKATPEVADGRVFTLGISGILSGWDAADGSLLWRRSEEARFPDVRWPLYGTGASPLALPGGAVVLVHLGEPGHGVLGALDAANGETVWELDGDGPAYVSPTVLDVAGTSAVFTMTEERIVAVAPETGRALWERPFTTPYDQNIVVPLLLPDGETVVFAGLGNATFAERFRPGTGGVLVSETVWEADDSPLYMSSPVLADGRILAFSERNSGQFVSLDPATGRSIWRSPPRTGENAALLVFGRTALALTDAAELLVLDPDAADFAPIRRYPVASTPTWAHPLPIPGGLLTKDESDLTAWRFPAGPHRAREHRPGE